MLTHSTAFFPLSVLSEEQLDSFNKKLEDEKKLRDEALRVYDIKKDRIIFLTKEKENIPLKYDVYKKEFYLF